MGSGIYEIKNTRTGRRYIGSAIVVRRRMRYHRDMLQRGKHRNAHLQSAWNKYGANQFAFSILIVCGPESLLTYEQAVMDFFTPVGLYNMAPRAGSQLGFRHSAETKKRMADFPQLRAGKTISFEHRKAISDGLKGRPVPPNVLVAAAARRGIPLSLETRAKMSAAKIGRKQNPEVVARRAASNIGKKRTEQQRANLVSGQVRRRAAEKDQSNA